MVLTKEMQEFQTEWERIGHTFGFNEVTAKVFATIYSHPHELSLDELARKTEYSLATISNTIRFIERFPMIKRIKKPGSKKVYVTAERDRLSMMEMKMQNLKESEIKPMKEKLPNLITSIKKSLQKAKTIRQKDQIKDQLNILENSYQETLMLEKINTLVLNELAKERKKRNR